MIGISANFVLSSIYMVNSVSHQDASQKAEIRALQNNARFVVNRETTSAEMLRVMEEIQKQLPKRVGQSAPTTANQYFDERYSPNGERRFLAESEND